MAYHTTDPYGITEINPSADMMKVVLESLEEADEADHPDASLIHDSGWMLTVYPNGTVTWENVNEEEPLDEGPLHMTGCDRERILALWIKLSRGHVNAIAREPWQRAES